MKITELRAKKNEELLKLLSTSYEQLRESRFQASIRKLKNVREITVIKKDIARILTLLIERNQDNG